jgi:DNA gyrase subunit B
MCARQELSQVSDNTADRITVLDGLEAVRRRPAMYIGAQHGHPSPCARLLERAVTSIAWEWRPQEVRILLWREDAVTIAYDGPPLPIDPPAPSVEDIPYPALYQSFMYLLVPSTCGMAVLNALSERLVVSTMHGGRRYRTVFSKGMIASLLRCAHCDCPLGTTWLTYRSDATIVAGETLTPDDLHGIGERVRLNLNGIAKRLGLNMEGVQIRVEDRMTEAADW